jgi:hypothetical protein
MGQALHLGMGSFLVECIEKLNKLLGSDLGCERKSGRTFFFNINKVVILVFDFVNYCKCIHYILFVK